MDHSNVSERRAQHSVRSIMATASAVMLLATLVATLLAIPRPDEAGAAPTAPAFCDRTSSTSLGRVASGELTEASGLVASHRYRGVLWSHNDSGDGPNVHAQRRNGTDLGRTALAASAIDWEDMALAPAGPGQPNRLYLADIGDNARRRATIDVYRTPEPIVRNNQIAKTFAAQKLSLRYPDGPHDAEALLVDPRRRDLIIITKEVNGMSGIYVAPAPQRPGATITLQRVGTLDTAQFVGAFPVPESAPLLARVGAAIVTGADVNRSGSLVAVRTYAGVIMYPRTTGEPLWRALTNQGCAVAVTPEPQGETVAFDRAGRGFVTISEGTRPQINHTRLR